MPNDFHIRRALRADRDWIFDLQQVSLHALGHLSYAESEIDWFVAHGSALDGRMIDDGTFLVALVGQTIVGCGGWSGQPEAARADTLTLRPAPKVHSVYVHPTFIRRGVGRRLMGAVERDMAEAGHDCATVSATLNSAEFFRQLGYCGRKAVDLQIADKRAFAVVHMTRRFDASRVAA